MSAGRRGGALALVLVLAACATTPPATPPPPPATARMAPPPRSSAPRPLKEHFDRAALQGHVSVLVFWASWCDYCAANMRDIAALQPAAARAGVTFTGLTPETDRAAAQAFVDRLDLPFDNYLDAEAEARRDRVMSLTTAVMIDASGQVLHRYARFAEGDLAKLEADLRALPPAR